MSNAIAQPVPAAIEELLGPYPDLLQRLRRYVFEAVHDDSITPCVERVNWTIKDALSAMMVDAADEARRATTAGEIALAIAHEDRRRAIALARSSGHGLNDYHSILAICTDIH